MAKILVTGAGGFIGSFIIEKALSEGHEVWAGVRANTSREYLSDRRIRFIDFDYFNTEKLVQQLRVLKITEGKWDYIVHNLGITKCRDPKDFSRFNYGILKNFVITLLSTQMVPTCFVLMSSLSSRGAGNEIDYSPIKETDSPQPDTLYGISKFKAEQYIESIPNFPYIILRPTGVYGPREKDYYLMMKSINYGIDFIPGFKKQMLSFIYVKDLVNIIFSAIEKGEYRKAYFVSDGKSYSSEDFRKYVANALGKKHVIPLKVPLFLLKFLSAACQSVADILGKSSTLNNDKYRIMKQRNWLCDTTPLQHDLNFTAEYDLEKGVNETVKWYKENGWL